MTATSLNTPPALIDGVVQRDEIPNIEYDTPVGIGEIAALLGVQRNTIDAWKFREKARSEGDEPNDDRSPLFIEPEPSTVGGRPWWRWGRVYEWAVRAGRLFPEPDGSAEDPVSLPS